MIHLFGIRHHGPGSARSVLRAFDGWQPDCVLIEGPADAADELKYAAESGMKPPVALLIYDPENPKRAAYYPFAEFSPEWQALRWAQEQGVPVRFMDLPQSHQMGETAEAPVTSNPQELPDDPLTQLARAAGYSDTERWWEQMVEHRSEKGDIFPAVLEAMTALREAAISSGLQRRDPLREQRREAWMRQTIRTAEKEGFQRVAVVCGAWHTPALAKMPTIKEDAALLKGLSKTKVIATWVPWTYGRLTFASGYGAGVVSPGWYEFLWQHAGHPALSARWLAKVAHLLRSKDLDASPASVVESVRLAETLAAVRGAPIPGLTEFNEATAAIFCFGDPLPMKLIEEQLIIGERLGSVPENTPTVPLAQDLAKEQKRLRFPPEATHKQVDLDLRKPNDLDRSRLLHRLNLLGITWGKSQRGAIGKGTFHELWGLQWQPEFAIGLIEAGIYGSTLATAAAAKVRSVADREATLPELTPLLDATLLADLPEAAEHVMNRIQQVAAVSSDVAHLMEALPPLVNVARYGNVRQTDAVMVASVIQGLIVRVCAGLPGACGSLNDEAAEKMFGLLVGTHAALNLLQNTEYTNAWNGVLRQLTNSPSLHGLIAGRSCRLLEEARVLAAEESARRFHLALSTAGDPAQAAAWIDGFLRQSGLTLIHDGALFGVVDEWVSSLSTDHFTNALPLIRRTFGTFAAAERRQIGERVVRGGGHSVASASVGDVGFDPVRADRALPLIAALLGLNSPSFPKSPSTP